MAGTILVVDDESATRRLVGYTLKSLEIAVLDAGDGKAALHVAMTNPLNLILVDINLPGMDGFKLIERLQEQPETRDIPVVMFTARNHPDDERKARALGVSTFLYKPFSTQELRSTVTTHMR